MKKKLFIFGTHLDSYPRNKVLVEALREVYDVVTCRLPTTLLAFPILFYGLFSKGRRQDAIIAIQTAQYFVPILLFFCLVTRKRLVFDAFISLYDTFVCDRKLVPLKSIKARYYFFLDKFSCALADTLWFDTAEHMKFFEEAFLVKNQTKKKCVIPVSVDTDRIARIKKINQMFPRHVRDKFIVLFTGTYIPLQGIEYIVEAAHFLRDNPDIHFIFMGDGQTKKSVLERVKMYNLQNVTFLPRTDYETLLAHNKSADLTLGIFGDTEKARRVIPNKVLDGMACGTLVITGKNSSMEHYFRDNHDIIFVPMADSSALAGKILKVYKGEYDERRIRENAQRVIQDCFSKKYLIKKFRETECI